MRKRILSLLIVLCLAFGMIPAVSASEIASGTCGSLIWTLTDDGTLTISGEGSIPDYSDFYNWDGSSLQVDAPWYEYQNQISALVINEGVSGIGGEAFKNCQHITHVSLPESLVRIDNSAFADCFASGDLILSDNVTYIGQSAFRNCGLTSVTFSDGFSAYLGKYIFSGSKNLQSVFWGEGITEIPYQTFEYCTNLVNVTLPESVKEIGSYAFNYCSSLTTITLPKGITKMGDGTFAHCQSLERIILPDNLLELEDSIFGYCTRLEEITIPASVTYVSDSAFSGCTSLLEISVHEDNPQYSSSNGALYDKAKSVLVKVPEGIAGFFAIDTGVTTIGTNAIRNFTTLSGIGIPDSITTIKYAAFQRYDTYDEEKLARFNVYYAGTPEDWETVKTESYYNDNQGLWYATIHFSSTDPVSHPYIAETTVPTCTEDGYTTWICECGHSYTDEYTNATGHNYEAIVTDPTCTEQGFTTHICANCNDSYIVDYVAALGHNMSAWEVVIAPSCTQSGMECSVCSRCDYTESHEISPTGHCHIATVTAPSCTEQGYTIYSCYCGDSYVTDYVDALGHEYADGICTRCGEVDPNYEKPTYNPFTDVPVGSFYEAPVLWALENGITTGAAEDAFDPNGKCLRAHVVTFLHRAAENPEPAATKNPFTDVKATDFFYKPVLWAVEQKITNGISADKFGSYDVCNRAAVVTFLWRAAGSPEPASDDNPFKDVKPTDFFYKPVLWAIENGITNGLTATEFGPTSPCNRAQVVTFLYRAYND